MDNPYWHTKGQTHAIDLQSIRRLCFELGNIVEASKSLAEHFEQMELGEGHSAVPDVPLYRLHREMAEEQILRLLLQLALMVRTYDDIMRASDVAGRYAEHALRTDGADYLGSASDNRPFDLREACNKIIHANEIRALYERLDREIVESAGLGDHQQDIWYLTGEIELSGTRSKKAWNAVLYVQPFIEVILDRISFSAQPFEDASGKFSEEMV